MFELKITDMEVVDGGTMQISWCVDEETLKTLSDMGCADPQVVLIVAPEGRQYHSSKEIRVVVPLQDLMAYITFRTAGPNHIFGFISTQTKRNAKNNYLAREWGSYKHTILEYDGSGWASGFDATGRRDYAQLSAEPLSVVVPTGVFAPEPPAWEKEWVNHFFGSRQSDQCNYRRRRLFAYSIQPLIIGADLLARFMLFLVSLLIVARGMSIKPLLHPLTLTIGDQGETLRKGSYLIGNALDISTTGKGFASFMFRKYWKMPLMPAFLVPLAILLHFVGVVKVLGGLALFVSIVLFGVVIVAFIFSGFFNWLGAHLGNLLGSIAVSKPKKEEKYWYLKSDEMDLLTCSTQKSPMTYDKLPPRKKTLHLRYQNLKSKVCKPFSA